MGRTRRGLVVALAVLSTAGVVGAHGGTAGSGVSMPLVVGCSALIGTATGLGAVAVGSRQVAAVLTHRRFALVLGVGLTLLGLSFLAPIADDAPGFALAGTAVGVALAHRVPHHHGNATPGAGRRTLVTGVLGAIGLHRVVEGVVLAAGFVAGSTVGLATAAVITVHAAGETAVVGTLLAVADRERLAVVAVLAVQTGFVVAATAATYAAVSVPTVIRSLVVAVAAGLLVSVGLHECRQCVLDWRATA
jgi:zinc transporter ZupT